MRKSADVVIRMQRSLSKHSVFSVQYSDRKIYDRDK